MDPRIENLETTTFFGKRLTRRQISLMQEAVELFPNDSRRELARTLCENFNWHTLSGTYREQFCLRVLEELEALGVLTLPERRETGGRPGPKGRRLACRADRTRCRKSAPWKRRKPSRTVTETLGKPATESAGKNRRLKLD